MKRERPQDEEEVIDDAEDSEDENESDEEDSEGSEEDEKLDDLPLQLLYASEDIIEETLRSHSPSLFLKGMKALEKSKLLLFALCPEIKEMVDKAMKRGNDGKVPPGSSLVRRSLEDRRFLLCQICIAQAKITASELLNPSNPKSIQFLQEALIYFPRSVEANFLLAVALLPMASSTAKLNQVEQLLKKAVATKASVVMPLYSGAENATSTSTSTHTSTPHTSTSTTVTSTSPIKPHSSPYEDDDKLYLQRDITAAHAAQESLSLLLCQSDRGAAATTHLLAQRFTWRLSNAVFSYPLVADQADQPPAAAEHAAHVQIFDGILPAKIISHLEHVFRTDGPYWSEHLYDLATNSSRSVGYFSYLYPLRERAPICSIEQVIEVVFKLALEAFPDIGLQNCTIAEWWVHSRPHCSGHQLHFDSDETQIEAGGIPHHPILSSVIFLNSSERVGGPTLVTDQTLKKGDLATQGWLCYPKENRISLFDAQYLHGVIPGRGVNQAPDSRRLTLMVGFWDQISARNRGPDSPGAGQPFPILATTRYTWPKEMPIQPEISTPAMNVLSRVTPVQVAPVWQETGKEEGDGPKKRPQSAPQYHECFQGF